MENQKKLYDAFLDFLIEHDFATNTINLEDILRIFKIASYLDDLETKAVNNKK